MKNIHVVLTNEKNKSIRFTADRVIEIDVFKKKTVKYKDYNNDEVKHKAEMVKVGSLSVVIKKGSLRVENKFRKDKP